MYIVLKRTYKHFHLHALIEAAKQSSEVNFILGPLGVSEMSWLKIPYYAELMKPAIDKTTSKEKLNLVGLDSFPNKSKGS